SPASWIAAAECVTLVQILNESSGLSSIDHRLPCPSSLAAVIFTSGTSGRPKGVMIEHRSIVRVAMQKSYHPPDDASAPNPVVAHLLNPAFDAAMMELYTAILNGFTLYCVDRNTLLDSLALGAAFRREGVKMAVFSPALLAHCLREGAALFKELSVLVVGGDRLKASHARQLKRLVQGEVFNGYGPTENTVVSTLYAIPSQEADVPDDVPIGAAVTGSIACVVDAQLRPVPKGTVGELVVAGDGLARGYLDSQLDTDKFVHVEIDGNLVPAYRTGDLARLCPEDMQLRFEGRIDQQVKVRGYRVEVAEVDTILTQHPAVADAATIPYQRDAEDGLELVSFVTESLNNYYADLGKMSANLGHDFLGWNSMYDGSPIPRHEMEEWLQDTLNTIRSICPTRHLGKVLEVGSGSGMILLNLASESQQYIGLEPSTDAVNFVNAAVESLSNISSKARVYQGSAAEVRYWMDEFQPDLVIVNSVTQLFPSMEYLFKVVEDCAEQQRPHQRTRLFFGDVRSYALYNEFLAHKALQNHVENMIDLAEFRNIVADQASLEKELLIHPAFFTTLLKKLSGTVEHVEILPKKMTATNELSSYRYSAVVYLRGTEAPPMQIVNVGSDAWIDANECLLNKATLGKRLERLTCCGPPSETMLAISNIPNSKIQTDRLLADALNQDASDQSIALSVSELHQKASSIPSLDIMELQHLARTYGLHVKISWARQSSQRGGLDAIFYREDVISDARGIDIVFEFPVENDHAKHGTLCNTPHRGQITTGLRNQLARLVREKLPSYMVPKALFILEEMPLTSNGKVDHKALACIAASEFAAAQTRDSKNTTSTSTSGPLVETKLRDLWATILKIDVASISEDDHFIHKGGDSIKAMRLMVEARRRGLNISVPNILTHPVFCEMARKASEFSPTEVQAFAEPANDRPAPFKLLARTSADEARRLTSELYDIPADIIEDIFPCTPLQAGLVALNLATPSDYIGRNIKTLQPDVDIDQFRTAFGNVVQAHPILRTRMIHLPEEEFVQAVVKETICLKSGNSIEEYIRADREDLMGLGKPLVRAALIIESTRRYFVLTMLHSVFDAWSMKIIFEDLGKAYRGSIIRPPPPFQSFIKAVVEHNTSEAGRNAWISNLDGNEAEQYPRLPSSSYRPKSDSVCSRRIHHLNWSRMNVTPAVTVRAALAILICQRENVHDVVFGTTTMGRDSTGVSEVEQMTGPTIATVPTRATLPREEETVGDMLVRLQHEWAKLTIYEHMGISAIRELSEDAMRASMFQTLLVVQPAEDQQDSNERHLLFERETVVTVSNSDLGAISTYAMVMQCHLAGDSLTIRVTFDSSVISEDQMDRMLSEYEAILLQLCRPEIRQQCLSEVEWLGEQDIRDIWTWNAALPETIDSSVHDLLKPVFQRQPDAQAIYAWDGSLTYEELDSLSTRLAHDILARETPESTPIPILVEKSKWTSVAMLAVMKASGTSCLLDPSLPQARLQSIVDQIDPKLILASSQQEKAARSLSECGHIVLGAAQASQWPAMAKDRKLPIVPASQPLYIVFTSGSTGVPKGVVISHRSFSSAIIHQHSRRSVGQHSRVLDFSSLTFDGSWFNLLHTLYVGGCICVPSEAGRQEDLKGNILQLGANFAFLTPSVISTLDAEALQALESVEIGGEAADPEEMRRIESHTIVRYIYGPSECTPITTLTDLGERSSSIGKAAGVLAWPVDPRVPSRLVGVGCVAELWLEGPLVGDGYYKEIERTTASFVNDPPWKLRDRPGQPGRSGRAYRTGDLVRFCSNGTMEFVGRVNSQQTKIRGQRVDLLDVQHNVQDALRKRLPDMQVVAGVGGGKEKLLTAFICASNKSWITMPFEWQMNVLQQMAGDIKKELAGKVPKYMIPHLFIPVESFPMTNTGKLDRQKLQEVAAGLTDDQRYACSLEADAAISERSEPQTPVEKQLRTIWATVLNINADKITINDNFFSRGGDSISAMSVVSAARRQGLSLSLRSLWDMPRLGDLAARLTQSESGSNTAESVPLPSGTYATAQVCEVLPLTWSQYQFFNGTLNGYASHVYHLELDLPAEIDAAHVKRCCERFLEHFDILRTRFICTAHRVSQIIEKEIQVPWHEFELLEETMDAATERICGEDRRGLNGIPDARSYLTRFFFIRGGTSKLIVRLCHAQYDGHSLSRMLDTLTDLLNGGIPVPVRPFSEYIRHIMSRNQESYQYWRNLLRGTHSPTILPPSHHNSSENVELLTVSKTVAQPNLNNAMATPAISFIAACATMLSRATHEHDIVFGCIVSGRSSVPVELRTVCGPCLNEVPIRVRFSEDEDPTTDMASKQVREQLLESSIHEAVGFDEIAAHSTSWSLDIEDFGLTAHYQNSGDAGEDALSGWRLRDGHIAPIPKANYVEVEALPLHSDGLVQITVKGKSSYYKERVLRYILNSVCRNLS
ncbi:Nonribosomal peptide synthetase TES, partial [Pseudocercospora fuligena]